MANRDFCAGEATVDLTIGDVEAFLADFDGEETIKGLSEAIGYVAEKLRITAENEAVRGMYSVLYRAGKITAPVEPEEAVSLYTEE